jgi:serine O-acetyltransferase
MFIDTFLDDRRRHRGSGAALAALTTHRFGRWAANLSSTPLRWLFCKVYGLVNMVVGHLTKIWLPPGATLGEGIHLIHGSGFIALHPTVVIGKRCGIMHNVTIGENMREGAARIGDDVFIGTGAVILGPVVIGDRVRIGANAVVTTDVPSDSIVMSPTCKIMPSLSMLAARTPVAAQPSPTTAREAVPQPAKIRSAS